MWIYKDMSVTVLIDDLEEYECLNSGGARDPEACPSLNLNSVGPYFQYLTGTPLL
jgi:hypothetical protein